MANRGPTGRSISTQRPHGNRSHIAIFVRCLHLLDLDLLEDWPDINEKLFASTGVQQNLAQRVKAVEWSLYRLFELYDPNEAKDKLRPFFPPVSQLQSVNLRAALYRCLSELKKDGVIAKDAILRKTMLDDCKGERFEDVIAGFAMGVLRRKTTASRGVSNAHVPEDQLVSKILACRVLLQKSLRDRKDISDTARHFNTGLNAAETRLNTRLESCEAVTVTLDTGEQKQMQATLSNNWIGNNLWADILLEGVPGKLAYNDISSTASKSPAKRSQDLLDGLDARIRKHHDQLSNWKVTSRELASRRKQRIAPEKSRSKLENNESDARVLFTSHSMLTVSGWDTKVSKQFLPVEPYDRLLSAMNQELSNSSAPTQWSAREATHPKVSTTTSSAADPASAIFEQSQDVSSCQTNSTDVSQLATSPAASTSSVDAISMEDNLEQSLSPSPMQSSNESTPWKQHQQSSATTVNGDVATSIVECTSTASKAPESPMSPSTLWLSLADRTRASMGLSNHQKFLQDPDSPVSQEESEDIHNYSQSGSSAPYDRQHSSLSERTRQSLSTLSHSSAPRPRKIKPEKRISQSFPVNQFETPGRPQRNMDLAPDSGASTPREELFDQDAEYASIFKSRPKLAMSPTFSPERGTPGLDSILEHDVERINLDSDQEID